MHIYELLFLFQDEHDYRKRFISKMLVLLSVLNDCALVSENVLLRDTNTNICREFRLIYFLNFKTHPLLP